MAESLPLAPDMHLTSMSPRALWFKHKKARAVMGKCRIRSVHTDCVSSILRAQQRCVAVICNLVLDCSSACGAKRRLGRQGTHSGYKGRPRGFGSSLTTRIDLFAKLWGRAAR
jgi:hypothetical protein